VLGLLVVRPIARYASRPQLKRFGVDALVGRRAYADTEVIVYKRTVRVGRMSGPHASPARTS
jgi:hypothetical protein